MIRDYKFFLMLIFLAIVVAIIILSPAKPMKKDCVIGDDGTCAVTVRAPKDPGIYAYTTCIDLNENGITDDGECTTATIEVRES